MNKIPVLIAAAAALATGCATSRITAPVDSGYGSSDPVFRLSEKSEAMKLALAVAPADETSKVLADGIRLGAEEALRERRFQVLDAGSATPSDVGLTITAAQSVFNNAADEYFTLDGSASMTFRDHIDDRLLASGAVSGRVGPILGRDSASSALAQKLSPDVQQWIRANVTPDQIPLSASIVQVSRANRHRDREPGFVADFVQAVSGLDGVIRCESAATDTVSHVATFRVLYRTASFPEGLLPALVKRVPQLDLSL